MKNIFKNLGDRHCTFLKICGLTAELSCFCIICHNTLFWLKFYEENPATHGYVVGKGRSLWFPEGASDYVLRSASVYQTNQI